MALLKNVTLLTLWSRVILEMLTGSQTVKKFPVFCANRRFITTSQVPATCPYPEHPSTSFVTNFNHWFESMPARESKEIYYFSAVDCERHP